MHVYGPNGKMIEVLSLSDEQRAEAELHNYVRRNCPEFGERIVSLMLRARVRSGECKHCQAKILWTNQNNYAYPLNMDTTQHLCKAKTKQEDNPWADGECPYCGELDCDCGV